MSRYEHRAHHLPVVEMGTFEQDTTSMPLGSRLCSPSARAARLWLGRIHRLIRFQCSLLCHDDLNMIHISVASRARHRHAVAARSSPRHGRSIDAADFLGYVHSLSCWKARQRNTNQSYLVCAGSQSFFGGNSGTLSHMSNPPTQKWNSCTWLFFVFSFFFVFVVP